MQSVINVLISTAMLILFYLHWTDKKADKHSLLIRDYALLMGKQSELEKSLDTHRKNMIEKNLEVQKARSDFDEIQTHFAKISSEMSLMHKRMQILRDKQKPQQVVVKLPEAFYKNLNKVKTQIKGFQ